ncbi:MAG: family 31 glucosidase, partial [Chloroflexi bacterium]
FSSIIWSGDVASTFETLQAQIRAGLNMAMSGIPWWTTDIGGFLNGDIRDPEFQELIVRWFQYGVFCPIFRLHGARLPFNGEAGAFASGAPNEVWSFGECDYAIIKDLLFLREKLKPYLMHLNRQAHETGQPPMRPLFFDFPEDPAAWEVEDAFLLGPALLVAPVMNKGQQQREVYLPAGADWISAWDGSEVPGGTTQVVNTPIETIPVYWRKGSSWQFSFKS